MPNVLIRNLDEKTIRRLKEQARENGRSLQAEMASILEEAAERGTHADARARLDHAAETLKKYLKPGPEGVELLREDRNR